MESSEHAAIGAVVSAVGVLSLRDCSLETRLALFGYGLLVSVFIDLDHFAWARLQEGDWSHLTRAVTNPKWAFVEQDDVFEGVEIDFQRLLSHVVIGGVTTLAFWLFSPAIAVYNAVVVYAHVLADLLRESRLA
ncbi:hypothetical protein [Halomarina rubra]|uniref:LexA-binding, inner membrane-associated hydrolase n=1 Tax=Halomarina rubra TaxID=2071873 RepID=A0ABD6AYD5_9EURY|nr:hypothetical protein [Halomarina rubra]